jgi:hypothetical protein
MPRWTMAQAEAFRDQILAELPLVVEADGVGDELWENALEFLESNFSHLELRKQYGTWAITSAGMVCLPPNTGYYYIGWNNMGREAALVDWLQHMSEKWWCNMNDFAKALYACERLDKKPQ